jgi:hypothetical protein
MTPSLPQESNPNRLLNKIGGDIVMNVNLQRYLGTSNQLQMEVYIYMYIFTYTYMYTYLHTYIHMHIFM